MRKALALYLLLLLSAGLSSLSAQMRIGEWRTHFSYAKANQVLYTPAKVYVSSQGHLYSYDPADASIQAYSMLDGLSGNQVSQMAYNEPTGKTLLLYSDGNMDIIGADGDIFNLSDYRDKTLAADKSVNRIRMYGKYALLATNIGLLQVDMQAREISESYIFRQPDGSYLHIKDAMLTDSCLYLLSDQGLYQGRLERNLLDFSQWQALNLTLSPLPIRMLDWQGQMLLLTDNRLYRYNVDTQTVLQLRSYYGFVSDMYSCGEYLLVCRSAHVLAMYNGEGRQLRFLTGNNITTDITEALRVDFDGQRMYAASGRKGLCIWDYQADIDAYACTDSLICPNGPQSQTAWKMFLRDDKLYCSSGGRWGDRYRWDGGLLCYDGEEWHSLIAETADQLKAKLGFSFQDVLKFAIDPRDENHIFACTWGDGLLEFRNGILDSVYNSSNSPLVTMFPDNPQRYVRTDGITCDSEGNFWLLNSDQINGRGNIHIIRPDGSWLQPDYSNFCGTAPSWDDILFASNGLVWINSERVEPGLFIIDTRGTLTDFSDDRTRWISTNLVDQDGNSYNGHTMHCVVEDLKGNIWVGGTYGPLILSNSASILDTATPTYTRVKVPRNDGTNEADYLLGNSMIYGIAVDAANRKWLATNNDGVYLLSEDGLETIHHFTANNSPLPSDVVYDILVHPTTGEVFMGTEAGIVSYRSDAVSAQPDYSSVTVYPNPVRPEFVGDVVVTGLMENSQVKITDINGRLMTTGRSLGGQFLWNLSQGDGSRVSTGVYLVFAAAQDGSTGMVAKIVVVN